MIVSVRLFAVARQRLGTSRVNVELPERATVAELRRRLAEQAPDLAPLLPGMMIAVDNDYARDERVIPENAEVALIPPVSGGSGSQDRMPVPSWADRGEI